MLRRDRLIAGGLVGGILVMALCGWTPRFLAGQGLQAERKQSRKSDSDGPQPVVIHREALRLIDPEKYQVPLQLVPIHTVRFAATTDGVVREVLVKPGGKIEKQVVALRLVDTEQQLGLQRAKANYKAAQIELQIAGSQKRSPAQVDLAHARLDAAKADLDLARLYLDRTSLRAPFAGQIFRVQAVAGQWVKAGQPLLTLADTSRLTLELPVDRKQATAGKPLTLRIEEQTIQVPVTSILPLGSRFESLRKFVPSIASAIVVIDNSGGKFRAGQTAYSPLIPRHPVTEVPSAAIGNAAEGKREVQVVRNGIVRNIPVQLLGPVGENRSFVSGPFAAGDEVIVDSSEDLPDGTRIRPSDIASTSSSRSGSGPRPQVPGDTGRKKTKRKVDF